MSMESSDALPVSVESTGNFWRDRPRWSASLIETRLRALMIAATLLVIPDLIMEEQPLRTSWHLAAQIGDWLIWLVFLVEFTAIMMFAVDRRTWLRSYPLAIGMLVLTPPFAPAAIQSLRAFRLLRLLRVARGFELLSKLLTLEGLKYAAALVVFLVVGGGTVFADVESHAGTHISTWTGIWWAIGTVSTEGTHIEAATDAGRAIAIVLMLTGMGAFGILTAAISQRFIASRAIPRAEALNQGEVAILARLDEIASRLDGLEATRPWPVEPLAGARQRITDTGTGPDLLTNITREPSR
jgi:voltage-gated potassium channel